MNGISICSTVAISTLNDQTIKKVCNLKWVSCYFAYLLFLHNKIVCLVLLLEICDTLNETNWECNTRWHVILESEQFWNDWYSMHHILSFLNTCLSIYVSITSKCNGNAGRTSTITRLPHTKDCHLRKSVLMH